MSLREGRERKHRPSTKTTLVIFMRDPFSHFSQVKSKETEKLPGNKANSDSPLLCGCYVIECIIFVCNLYPGPGASSTGNFICQELRRNIYIHLYVHPQQ